MYSIATKVLLNDFEYFWQGAIILGCIQYHLIARYKNYIGLRDRIYRLTQTCIMNR